MNYADGIEHTEVQKMECAEVGIQINPGPDGSSYLVGNTVYDITIEMIGSTVVDLMVLTRPANDADLIDAGVMRGFPLKSTPDDAPDFETGILALQERRELES